VFRASFNTGGGETDYWIEATDLLGNGPASYGSGSTPVAIAGGRPEPGTNGSRHRPVPPIVQHRKPTGDLPAGQEVTLRARIRADGPISSTALHVREPGQTRDTTLPMHRVEGDTYEATIPVDRAHGTLEYRIAARDRHGLQTLQGEAKDKWFSVTFKPAAPAEPPFSFAVNPPRRIPPGSPISVRAQITGPASTEDVVVPDRARVLYRGADGRDQTVDMKPDPTGGLGGFKAELPGQASGPVYFQVLACDALESRCALDTGDKRKWHGVSIAKTPGPPPPPLDSPSAKLPSTMQ
jgi:hypothetical protein